MTAVHSVITALRFRMFGLCTSVTKIVPLTELLINSLLLYETN